jgi:GT2 family glycosyltransferase
MSALRDKKTAAIVLNYRDRANTLRLIKNFCEFDIIDNIELVDNSGSDAIRQDEILGCKVDLLYTNNEGYARGNNRGIMAVEEKHGSFDFFIISNSDIEVSNDAINACIKFLYENDEYAVAAPRMKKLDGTYSKLSGWRERTFLCDLAYSSGILSRLIGMYRETYPPQHWQTSFSTVDCVAGSFFVVKAEVLKKVEYFDEKTFLFYEEDILGFKLKKLGYKEAILNDFHFVHYEGVSSSSTTNFFKKYIIMQKSRLYFHRKYTRLNIGQQVILYVATGIGIIENVLKTLFYHIKCKMQSKTTEVK